MELAVQEIKALVLRPLLLIAATVVLLLLLEQVSLMLVPAA
jgi:hypothetical protein